MPTCLPMSKPGYVMCSFMQVPSMATCLRIIIYSLQVFTNANRFRWGLTETLANGVCGVEREAKEMDLPVEAVTEAFKKVGLKCPNTVVAKKF